LNILIDALGLTDYVVASGGCLPVSSPMSTGGQTDGVSSGDGSNDTIH